MSKKILFVDDSPAIRKFVSFTLKFKKYEVEVAENGNEALEKLKSFTPHLIITDLLMPIMDGFEFIKSVKQDDKLKQIRIMILTTEGQADAVKRGKELGAYPHLKKPFQPEQLIAIVAEIVGTNGESKQEAA